jgi:hypothetical protein
MKKISEDICQKMLTKVLIP